MLDYVTIINMLMTTMMTTAMMSMLLVLIPTLTMMMTTTMMFLFYIALHRNVWNLMRVDESQHQPCTLKNQSRCLSSRSRQMEHCCASCQVSPENIIPYAGTRLTVAAMVVLGASYPPKPRAPPQPHRCDRHPSHTTCLYARIIRRSTHRTKCPHAWNYLCT